MSAATVKKAQSEADIMLKTVQLKADNETQILKLKYDEEKERSKQNVRMMEFKQNIDEQELRQKVQAEIIVASAQVCVCLFVVFSLFALSPFSLCSLSSRKALSSPTKTLQHQSLIFTLTISRSLFRRRPTVWPSRPKATPSLAWCWQRPSPSPRT